MGVYIRGMEMPKSCYDCDFAYQDQDSEHNVYWTCAAVHKSACMHERREDCPLVPVPPHGRLIDADAFEDFIRKDWDKNDHWIADVVYSRPTIIPADPAEEGES